MTMPKAYMNTISSPRTGTNPSTFCAGNSEAMISVYTGSRAEQVVSGTTIMVSRRSRRRSIVRVAMMAGTAQANPDRIGTKARPCRFMLRMIRSIR